MSTKDNHLVDRVTRGGCYDSNSWNNLVSDFDVARAQGKESPWLPHMRSKVLGFHKHLPAVSTYEWKEATDILYVECICEYDF